ncbi:Hsp70 family protein [Amniculicola lignicola CBS 123094]|uniref:Hsp70 family protein n=1 Tax=Amniculicola lignicola CBS 123094 TaxID=1392246 RepID=A0A6A5WLX1_9PLEO|nr:Hsp70 family protein [Amniculicola lignicola CBS 123094]
MGGRQLLIAQLTIIGLDFGTTYTGVAFCESSALTRNDTVDIIRDWPSAHSMVGTKDKVPSEIAYSANGTILWGSLIPPHMQRYIWTKLRLNQPQETNGSSPQHNNKEKQPVDIIADFLSEVRKHLIKNLDARFGEKLWRTLPVTLVVTVPADWRDAAKHATLQAVKQAGFNETGLPQLKRIITTTEPEAAALYTIHSMKGGVQEEQLKVGDGLILCDMGGGTVDLISYRVTGIKPTIVEEATAGAMALCGGSFVDCAFIDWLERKVGVDGFLKIAGCSSSECRLTALSTKLAQMVQEFSLMAKSGFSGTEEYYLRLPFPLSGIDDPMRGMCDGSLYLRPKDIEAMFEFSLIETKRLIAEQIQQARQKGRINLKSVFLVGGFAESPYLQRRLKAFCASHSLATVKPPNAWSSIVRGSLLKALALPVPNSTGISTPIAKPTIQSRRCRRSYGTSCTFRFVEGKHRIVDRYYCGIEKEFRAKHQVNWLLYKDQVLDVTHGQAHAKLDFTWNFPKGGRKEMIIPLLASDQMAPSIRSLSMDVHKVADLVVDISFVPQSTFKKCVSTSGEVLEKLQYSIEIKVHEVLEFSLLIDGVRYGTVVAKYA